MSLVNTIRKNLVNVPGWRSKKKILVIESDDWGTISMPSMQVYSKLLAAGVPVDRSPFSRVDILESQDDLAALFDVLTKFKDHRGNHPMVTAETIVANPDFNKISGSKFETFYFEPFTETYKRYPGHERTFEVWKEGMPKRLLWPQLHGREHLNPFEWLRLLKNGEKLEKVIFEHQAIFASPIKIASKRKMGYLAAFDYETPEELSSFRQVISNAADLFEKQFGFRSISFVAPTSIRSDKMDTFLFENGIKFHQLGQQLLPAYEGYKKKDRFWGQSNSLGQIYWRRNSRFEPSSNPSLPWADIVMNDIDIAFKWRKPAVISSHRVNFVGGISPENRSTTLQFLSVILERVIKKYPDVEFMTSDQLGEQIALSKKGH